jgi:ribosomal protein S18 acetylase RimI-like enzyme
MLSRIQSSLRKGISQGAERVGPFLVRFDEHSDSLYRNYAIPDDAAQPSAEDVVALLVAFARHGRTPRLEYVAPAPAVDDALAAAGFTVDLRLPLMTIAPEELRDPAEQPGVEVVEARSEEDLRAAAWVQNIAYGEPADVGDVVQLGRLRATTGAGGAVMLARREGAPAGAGLFTPPHDGLAEIAAIGVIPEHRRRGIASAVGAALTRAVFAAGVIPYLQTETRNEQRLYGRLGYRAIGELTAISLSPGY